MKNCESCDNALADDAKMCYVCYARVGEGVRRPPVDSVGGGKTYLFVLAIIFLLIFGFLLFLTIVIDEEARQIISFVLGGIGLVSLLMKLFTKKSR